MSLWLPDDKILKENPALMTQALERYRRVLGCDGYAFWEWDVDDNNYSCGGSFWLKLGYTTMEEAVACLENLEAFVHPDDFTMVYDSIVDHLRLNTPIDLLYRIKAKDGDYCWTQSSAHSTRDQDGRVTYLSGVNFDLSHLKETEKALRLSEARHQRILAASNDGVWEWSMEEGNENGFSYTSYSCWEHLGYSEEDVDALPKDERLIIWRSYIHPDDLIKMHQAIKRHFTLKEPFDMEYRMLGRGGQLFWMRARGQAVFNSQGRAILMSGINIDVTALKEAEGKVRLAKEVAEKANNAKSHFLSSMSHELRTPLNAIMGFSQLSMYDETLPPRQQEHAAQIYKAGEHLLSLVNDVLDLAQIESGQVALTIEPVLPERILQDCFSLVKPLADKRCISLVFQSNRLENIYISADTMRLKQCLLNIVSNAVKYNADDGEVCVSLHRVDEHLEITVEDAGLGLTKEQQLGLFQPFNRLGAEYSSIEGSGIGLVITQQLVESMGGVIRYDDRRTKGACFVVRLPLAQLSPSSLALLAPNVQGGVLLPDHSSITADQTLAFSGARSILYIEDNPQNIMVLEALLSPYSRIRFSSQSDPLLGLFYARTHPVDLILLDINLPEVSGLELVKILKVDPDTQHIPVVALSANAMPHLVEAASKQGFDDYLTKPVNIMELVRVLNHFFTD